MMLWADITKMCQLPENRSAKPVGWKTPLFSSDSRVQPFQGSPARLACCQLVLCCLPGDCSWSSRGAFLITACWFPPDFLLALPAEECWGIALPVISHAVLETILHFSGTYVEENNQMIVCLRALKSSFLLIFKAMYVLFGSYRG